MKYLHLAPAWGENAEVVSLGTRENGETQLPGNMFSQVKVIELPLGAREGNDESFK